MVSTMTPSASRILKRITCPHCWHRFAPENILWIAEHADLRGDPRLGSEQLQRFLPTRFTVDGEAVDAKGFPCRSLACPNCHLEVPRALLEMEPLFLSILGETLSGKSYFLASLIWQLRRLLPLHFAMSFSDADPLSNAKINEYENALFSNAQGDSAIPLADLIPKTQAEDQGLYETVMFGTQRVQYPRPFLFSMQPQAGHPNAAQADRRARVVCLYDNAGENFHVGADTTSAPVTRHLALSRALFFLFDPTQETQFRNELLRRAPDNSHLPDNPPTHRQETILQEAASRIRRHTGLRQNEKHNRPLIVILTKYDSWSPLLEDLEDAPPGEPWREVPHGRPPDGEREMPFTALDLTAIERRSQLLRRMLLEYSPEIVTAAEGIAKEVVYVPVSALGWRTHVDHEGELRIRPADIDPYWVTVPFLYALCRWTPGLIPAIKKRKR